MEQELENQVLKRIIEKRDVKFLCKYKFGYDLTEGQTELVRKIAFREHKRMFISAHTRYGKTFCVADGIGLMIDLANKKFIPRVAFIGPQKEQAGILRQYMADLILRDPDLLSKALVNVSGEGRIKKEASRNRMTFSNGAEYRVMSGEGTANRIMGFGANIIIVDEGCLVNKTAWVKITRMLGDDPENSIMIVLVNPWDTDNKAYDYSLMPRFDVTHIDYKQGIREGRITQAFVDERAEEYGGTDTLEFTVLYKSEFPEMSEDALFNSKWFREAFDKNRSFTLSKEVNEIRKGIIIAERLNNTTIANNLKEKLKEYKIIIACDPADKGKDKTVIYWLIQHGNLYQKLGVYWEAKSENMDIASKMYAIHNKIHSTHWRVDGHGLGIGVLSRLRQIKRDLNVNVYIKACMHGGKVLGRDKRKYKNQKSVNHFRLRRILKEGRFDLSEDTKNTNKTLFSQAMKMKWERNQSELILIIDPGDKEADKTKRESPDFVHALEYCIWEDKGTLNSVNVGAL